MKIPISDAQELFVHELGEIYDAEHQFIEGQQEMIQNATDEDLKGAIREHLGQTEQHASNLERALAQLGQERLPLGIHSPGHVADSDARARDELWPHYQGMRNRIGAERGWGPTSRAEFDREVAAGSLYVGSPETVARKIAATVRALGASRFDMKYSAGTLPHELMLRSIELFGREVMPRVRRMLAEAPPTAAEPGVAALGR